jgi:hypothetical protein
MAIMPSLPGFFKSILWFSDLRAVHPARDRDIVLFQALEKGRMEHLRYLLRRFGRKALLDFARRNEARLSRRSILPFIEALCG